VLLWASVLLGCDGSKASGPVPSRVEAVGKKQGDESAESLCDKAYPREGGLDFVLPKVEGTVLGSGKGARWVNVWATWCPPCVEELPRLMRMAAELDLAGAPLTLQLLSVDSTAEAVDAYVKKHPDLADSVLGSVRLSEAAALGPWLTSMGLDEGATLPVHLFVGRDGKVKCARTGAVRDSDLRPILKVLTGR
jgi:thiol-disulfide isomerase/thioredoxin